MTYTGTPEDCDALQAIDDAQAGYPAILGEQRDGGYHGPLATQATVTDPETGAVRRGGRGVVMHVRAVRGLDALTSEYTVPPQEPDESRADYIERLRTHYEGVPPGLLVALASVS